MKKSLPILKLLLILSVTGNQTFVAVPAQAQPQFEQEAAHQDLTNSSKVWATGARKERYVPPVSSQPNRLSSHQNPLSPPLLSELNHPTTTITDWVAQIEASLVQITGVRLEETGTGLQVILETTDGELATPTTTVLGNALIVEISNAVLRLDDNSFQQFAPIEGIASVQISELQGDRVQVAITGTNAVPTVEIDAAAMALILTTVPGAIQANEGDETLQIVVTDEEESRYVASEAFTATRTNTPLRDIPQSIQVIPREVLDDQQVLRLNDAIRNVSGGVSANQGGGGQRFILRGFSSPSVLRDGFRLSFGGDGNPGIQELSNLEAIEVLKGPASILFGSLEPGGIINLVTEQPLSEPFYNLSLRIGNRALFEPSLDFSGPLGEEDRVFYRLNALYRTEDSFRDFDADFNRFFIAPVVRWQINDRTDLTINFEYLDSEGPSDAGLVALGNEVADIPFDRVLGDPEDAFQSEIVRIGYDFEHRFSDHWRVRNAFRFNSFDVESSQFVALALDESTGNLTRSLLSTNQDQDHFEFQTNLVGEFNTGAIEHRLLVGFDLFRRENPRFDTFAVTAPEIINIFDPVYGRVPRPDPATAPIFIDSNIQIDALGIYIQDQINLLDNLILLAGIRYETVEQDVTNNPSISNPMGSELNQNDEALSPRIGLLYQPIEEVSLYGSYSTSFVPNSEITIDGGLLDPERGEQFEIGIRAELLNRRLTANLAFFELTKQNVATPDPDNFGFSVATGEQRSRGIELDIAGEVLPGWNIIANYAFTDADITEDNSDIEGNRLFSVPEHNINLWTTYNIQDGSLAGLGVGLGFNYVSDRFGDNANSFELDSYFLTNAAISYERDNWRAALNIRNLFDVAYIEGSQNSRLSFISPGEGLTLIGSFSIEF